MGSTSMAHIDELFTIILYCKGPKRVESQEISKNYNFKRMEMIFIMI